TSAAGLTPRTNNPTAIGGKNVSEVPRSGCKATRPIGTKQITQAFTICLNVMYRLLRSSERYRANATTTTILINSDGWIVIFPKVTQLLDPETRCPKSNV